MKSVLTRTLHLKGTNYSIGHTLGTMAAKIPPLAASLTSGFPGFGPGEVEKASALFARWCPGLNEELAGFADALGAAPERILFYAMTYLRPACSQIALLPSKTDSGHPLLARSYEFNDEAEDFCLVKTSPEGRYTHLGTSVLQFGRDDGFNEHGLAVTMSSCGFPVGANKHMRRPAITGLQFWAVIRALLENCRDAAEALAYLKDMPIAFNLNLMLLDKSGNAALVETLDGRMAVKQIRPGTGDQYLHATNHSVLESLLPYEPNAMENSLKRYDTIKEFLESSGQVSVADLKSLLLSKYPAGLCCHYYKDFFGTTKSMIIDPKDGTIELCWGGRIENGWRRYRIGDPMADTADTLHLINEAAGPALFQLRLRS